MLGPGSVRSTAANENLLAVIVAAIAGALAGRLLWRKPVAGILVVSLALVGAFASGVLFLIWARVLVNPLVPVSAGVAAAGLAFVLVRHVPARPARL